MFTLLQSTPNRANKMPRKALFLLILSATLFAGCSTAQSSSPFFMYSSPLLDGDMRAQRTQDTTYHSISTPSSGKAKPVYVRQSHPTTNTPAKSNSSSQKPTPTAHPALATSAPRTTSPALNHSAHSTSRHAANYAWTTYAANNVDLPQEARSNIAVLYRACRERGEVSHNKPRPGDLAYFHNTFDANKDNRNNDWYTHVAIVETVAPHGQISLLRYQNKHVQRFHMNLEHVDSSQSPDGTILNSELRPQTSQDAPFTQYLSGQLFAGYCSLLGQQQDLIVIDNWQPAKNH